MLNSNSGEKQGDSIIWLGARAIPATLSWTTSFALPKWELREGSILTARLSSEVEIFSYCQQEPSLDSLKF